MRGMTKANVIGWFDGAAAAFVALLLGSSPLAKAASFQGLGDLPGGSFQSVADAVSGDESVVVGVSLSDALRLEAWGLPIFPIRYRWYRSA